MSMSDDIGALLHREHLNTLAIVNRFEERVLGHLRDRVIDGRDASDGEFLNQFVAMIDNDIRRHFRFEEDVLFPEVARQGLGDITGLLVEEHAIIRPMAETLRALAESALSGPLAVEDWRVFRDVGMDLIHSVMFHVQKEEMGLIRRLPALVDSETNRAFAARYAAVEP